MAFATPVPDDIEHATDYPSVANDTMESLEVGYPECNRAPMYLSARRIDMRSCHIAILALPNGAQEGRFHTPSPPDDDFLLPKGRFRDDCEIIVTLARRERSTTGSWQELRRAAADLLTYCRIPHDEKKTAGGTVLAGTGNGIKITVQKKGLREETAVA
ncbi:MAG: hypothetical protein LQ342_007461 [Letrouitia transgressa]|nr:MAG: hypothetical protein LQ342_007461 [Letrouitia transgressa]